ncbi:MAG: TRAM domain-containing protein [Deltaproteobacteria bacterium]|nr:TRAM domain-containing protein [Deltaproteobacteria bacterium]
MKWFIRILIALLVFYGAYNLALVYPRGELWPILIPGLALVSLIIIFIKEYRGFSSPASAYIGASIGAILGLVIANLFGRVFLSISGGIYIYILINTFLGYLGYSIGISKGEAFVLDNLGILKGRVRTEGGNSKLLDTSVIIDGRISDICDTGFIEGVLIVPQFILNELQHIADSSDPLKRARGRRGLDILNRLQKHSVMEVKIIDQDFPKIKEVDSKLIALAKDMGAVILTNDFNLNKVAQIQGITVLNINLLANALKPTVLPGEGITVRVTKQGKEKGQGVAYLEDGTMIVIEGGESLLGKDVEVVVSSILQTPAGRMIFAAPKDGIS